MYDIQQIKDRVSCVDIAKQCGLMIRKAGDRIASPLRPGADNKSAFVVHDEFFYDFVAGTGGDCIDLLAELKYDGHRGMAIRELGEMVGADTNRAVSVDWKDYFQNLGNGIYYWNEHLKPEHIKYITDRGITEETINRLKIGYNENYKRIIIPYMKNGYYYNWIGRAYGDMKPKYYKPPKDEYTDDAPWGMHTLDRNNDTLYICEGAFDALSFEQEGCSVIAMMGGSFNKQIIPMILSIMKQFKKVILAFDSDDAGKGFTKKFCKLLCSTKLDFDVILIPDGFKDISEYYAAGNDLAKLQTINGLIYLVEDIEDIDEFEEFILSIAKYASPLVIDKIFDYVEQYTNWSKRAIKTMEKTVKNIKSKPPKEIDVANEILNQYTLKFHSSLGFYEYKRGCWRHVDDADISQHVIDELGDFATHTRSNNIVGLIKKLAHESCVFNETPVWSFPNGTLELDTGKFRENRPEDLCSIQMDYPYKGNAKCPTWEKFISSVMANSEVDIQTLQTMAGYVLFNDCSLEKIFILTGTGGNGKSLFTSILEEIFGFDNCTSISPANTNKQFYAIKLKHSILNIAAETSANLTRCAESLKALASGDTIQGCFKGKDIVDFKSRTKLIFATNDDIISNDTSDGLLRRLHVINFPMSFVDHPDPNNPLEQKKDVHLKQKLLLEKSGIFNWVFKGYKQLKATQEFPVSATQERFLVQFKRNSEPLIEFMEELPRQDFTNAELYELFKAWQIRTNNEPIPNNKFHERFRKISTDIWKPCRPWVTLNGERKQTKGYKVINCKLNPLDENSDINQYFEKTSSSSV